MALKPLAFEHVLASHDSFIYLVLSPPGYLTLSMVPLYLLGLLRA